MPFPHASVVCVRVVCVYTWVVCVCERVVCVYVGGVCVWESGVCVYVGGVWVCVGCASRRTLTPGSDFSARILWSPSSCLETRLKLSWQCEQRRIRDFFHKTLSSFDNTERDWRSRSFVRRLFTEVKQPRSKRWTRLSKFPSFKTKMPCDWGKVIGSQRPKVLFFMSLRPTRRTPVNFDLVLWPHFSTNLNGLWR